MPGEYKEGKVVLPILASIQHCNADCPGLDTTEKEKAWCLFFNEELKWDGSKQWHGWIRLPTCRFSEVRVSKRRLDPGWLAVVRADCQTNIGRLALDNRVVTLLEELDRLYAREVTLAQRNKEYVRRYSEADARATAAEAKLAAFKQRMKEVADE